MKSNNLLSCEQLYISVNDMTSTVWYNNAELSFLNGTMPKDFFLKNNADFLVKTNAELNYGSEILPNSK